MSAARRALVVPCALFASTGCSGALPLFHGADTLPKGLVTAGAGVAANLVRGDAATALRSAQETTVVGVALRPEDSATYRRGALVAASFAPGLAPWFGARVGVGWSSDAGLSYTQRSLRVDARKSFLLTDRVTLSVGAGVMTVLGRRGDGQSADLAGLDLSGLRGLGADVPVLVGYQSSAGLVRLYAGLRAGYEVIDGDIAVGPPSGGDASGNGGTESGTRVSIEGRRLWGSGILGFALGFRHLFGVAELSAGAASAKGKVGGGEVSAVGIMVSPGAALVGRF